MCIEPDAVYTPGVRLYFDVKKIIEDKIATRDGLHLLKVRGRLPLKPYLLAAITADDFSKDIAKIKKKCKKQPGNYFEIL